MQGGEGAPAGMTTDDNGQGVPKLQLPDDVRVLDLGFFVVEFALSGKIVFASKDGSGTHLTYHPGGASGVADLHVTRPGANDAHQTLYAMSHASLAALGVSLPAKFEALMERIIRRTCRKVRVGWLRHHGILALPMVPQGSEGLLPLGRRRGKRFELDPSRLEASIEETMREFDLGTAADGPYLLFLRSQSSEVPYGALVKFRDERNRPKFVWFKTSTLIAELTRMWAELRPEIEAKLADEAELGRLRAVVEAGGSLPDGAGSSEGV